MYQYIKPLLFSLDAEVAHTIVLKIANLVAKTPLKFLITYKPKSDPTNLLGLNFPNKVGLAAGMDKDGAYIDVWNALGFGFIEVGTVTPKPQAGNPKPRLFRIPEEKSVINRMGFNNKGVNNLIENLKKSKFNGVLGINIGKNKDTEEGDAYKDYVYCLEKVYQYADFIVINISSPNTPNLRKLQFGEALDKLLSEINKTKEMLIALHKVNKPILVKVAPDLTDEEIKSLSESFLKHKIDGVIATNTTNSRDNVKSYEVSKEAGGLSGEALREMSTKVIKKFREALPENYPIIGVGGVKDKESAKEKLATGANLVQLYTGLIYEGPNVVSKIVNS